MTPTDFRRHLHAHPELSFREEATAAFIAEQLAAAGIECRRIARTGVLARIEGRLAEEVERPAATLSAPRPGGKGHGGKDSPQGLPLPIPDGDQGGGQQE